MSLNHFQIPETIAGRFLHRWSGRLSGSGAALPDLEARTLWHHIGDQAGDCRWWPMRPCVEALEEPMWSYCACQEIDFRSLWVRCLTQRFWVGPFLAELVLHLEAGDGGRGRRPRHNEAVWRDFSHRFGGVHQWRWLGRLSLWFLH